MTFPNRMIFQPWQSFPEVKARRTVRSLHPIKSATAGNVRITTDVTISISLEMKDSPLGKDTSNS